MRQNDHYSDYNHIRVYGAIKGHAKDFIQDQQKLAYLVNAPYDTVELVDGKIVRFYDLTKDERQQFKGV